MPAKKKAAKLDKKPGEVGRKLLDIDEEQVKKLAIIGASNREMGDWFGCDGDTIGRRFADVIAKAKASTYARLRKKQLDMALDGDRTMLVWLGKQMLKQTDTPTVAIQNVIGGDVHKVPPATADQDLAFLQRLERVKAKHANPQLTIETPIETT